MNAILLFLIARLADELNGGLMLFIRADAESAEALGHTTQATERLRSIFLAATMRRHSGQIGVR